MRTILIIDDEDMIRDLLNRALTRLNYSILTAENGATGVDLFGNRFQEIDMVIVDMLMPDMNGGEVIRRLKAIDPNVITVLSSGQGECEVQAVVSDVEATGYILKPFRISQLSDSIDEIFKAVEVVSRD